MEDTEYFGLVIPIARRTSITLFSILNGTTNHVSAPHMDLDININKEEQTENCTRWSNETVLQNQSTWYSQIAICRPLPQDGDVTLFPVTCLQGVRSILSDEVSKGGVVTPDFELGFGTR